MNCPLPQLVEKSTDRSSLCSENLYKGWSNRFHMNRILPFSLNFVEKVKMLAFQIHQDACLVFLVYSVFIAVAPLLPPPNPGDPCWLDEDTNCSEGGSFQLCYEGVWWIRQTKTGVFSRLRQFCLLLALQSHFATAIELPPGQATHTLAQGPPKISRLKEKQGLQVERDS